jgi:solute carrier family 35 (UDP-galactose transporter), member B1
VSKNGYRSKLNACCSDAAASSCAHNIAMVASQAKLVLAIGGIYGSFLVWGYLQERITSTTYGEGKSTSKWNFPIFLNFCMAVGAWIAGWIMVQVTPQQETPPASVFWKPALSCTLASPFGCEYIWIGCTI